MTQESQNTQRPTNVEQSVERGKEIYAELQKQLNIEDAHNGKYIAIDVVSRKYFIGETRDEAVQAGKAALPDVIFFVKRIGGIDTVARRYPFLQRVQSTRARFL